MPQYFVLQALCSKFFAVNIFGLRQSVAKSDEETAGRACSFVD